MRPRTGWAVAWMLATVAGRADAEVLKGFEARVFRNSRGETIPYRLFRPSGSNAQRKDPLVVWLHGGAGRGSDNRAQLVEGNAPGATVWTRPENQARFPTFVLAPQAPSGGMWATSGDAVVVAAPLRLVVELLKQLPSELAIDTGRVYVAGQSLGGYGAWALAHPELFAAVVPLCGGGDETQASRLVKTPIWAFHGRLDTAVGVERSRRMIAAVQRAGGLYREFWEASYERLDAVLAEMKADERNRAPKPRQGDRRMKTATRQLQITTPSDREVALTRVFDAPRRLVFEAWTRPELVERWLGVRAGWSLAVCEIDLRVGGRYRYVWRGPKGEQMGMGGVFKEIAPPERLVVTEKFDESWYPGEAINTTVLLENAGKTTMTLTVRYETKEARDAVLATPMATGMGESFDTLAAVLGTMA